MRKRIFGGFSVILLLLAVLAWVALRGMAAAGAGAARVSDDSAQATASAEVALLVGEARALVVQYALTSTMDDQKAAQAGLTRLDQAIERNGSDGSASGGALQALAGRYRSAVNDAIACIDNNEALVPNQVDFVEFMMSLSGNAAKMEGTAVTADELWTLGDDDPLAGIPNHGAPDHRYLESEDDALKLTGPSIVSVGGGVVPAGAWERSA